MQVVRLHDRSSALLAELEEHKAARSSRGAAAGAARAMDQSAAPSEAAARAAACAADKELMLKQIDSLKEVRCISVAAGEQMRASSSIPMAAS